jgi:hypothetical protein
MKKHTSLVLVLLLSLNAAMMLGCAGKAGLPFDGLKARANRVKNIYAPGILQMIDTLLPLAEVQASPEATALLNKAKTYSIRFRDDIVPLADLIASLATIDATNKEDVRAKLAAAQRAWDELSPLLSEIGEKIASKITQNDVVRFGVVLAPQAVSLALGIIASRIQ